MKQLALIFFSLFFIQGFFSLNINLGIDDAVNILGKVKVEGPAVKNENDLDIDTPPPHEDVARMARYITHTSEWGALATTSVRDPIKGYPFANVFSVSDGPVDYSSGTPYFYISPWEISAQDLTQDPRASLTMSLAQGNFCSEMNYDPEDPRCAHVIFTGKFVILENDSEEANFAQEALFTRHPSMEEWPVDHGWFFAKLDIENIIILDFFGGAITVPIKDYFDATPTSKEHK